MKKKERKKCSRSLVREADSRIARLEYLSPFQSARAKIPKRFSLTIDIKYVYWITDGKGES